jgi:hypothetical protein
MGEPDTQEFTLIFDEENPVLEVHKNEFLVECRCIGKHGESFFLTIIEPNKNKFIFPDVSGECLLIWDGQSVTQFISENLEGWLNLFR